MSMQPDLATSVQAHVAHTRLRRWAQILAAIEAAEALGIPVFEMALDSARSALTLAGVDGRDPAEAELRVAQEAAQIALQLGEGSPCACVAWLEQGRRAVESTSAAGRSRGKLGGR